MLFPTIDFAVFFAVVLAVCWALPSFGTRWKLAVLAASYVFYGWWDYRFVALIAASTLGNHVAAHTLRRTRQGAARRALLAIAIGLDLAVLGYFKYLGFLVNSAANALHALGAGGALPVVEVVLPVGISFFTFQAISYLVDVHRGHIEPAPLLDFAVFLSFFPHVVAGPIVRAAEFIPQLHTRRAELRIDTGRALSLIIGGLFKKVVVASFLAGSIVDSVFATPAAHSGLDTLVGIYGYAVQIWADFSGYTDIAIGCALLLGIRFPDNFNSPYRARSLREFWRRWHMTLSRWLRDYLYIPLGGSRVGRLHTYRNLLITMLLGGLWHGAAWTFVIWGAIHGGGMAVERAWRDRRGGGSPAGADDSAGRRILAWLVTFHVVCLAWVFFRADSLPTAWQVLANLVNLQTPTALVTPPVLLAVVGGVAVQFVPRTAVGRAQEAFSRWAPALQGAALATALMVMGAMGPAGVAPFIYYRF